MKKASNQSVTHKDIKVSAIVPIYNEHKTVVSVVKKLLKHPLIHEVICVDDGSTDNSVQKLKNIRRKIIFIQNKKNYGKGHALSMGIKKAKYEVVAFFDADLLHLTNSHINELLTPILFQDYRGVLGYKMPSKNDTMGILTQDICGERAYYKKDLFPHLPEMARARFGTEVFLNNVFKNYPIKKIPLIKLDHLQKHEKFHPKQAIKEHIKEIVEVAQQLGKQEGLISKDSDIMSNLSKLTDLKEIKKTINNITNKDIKDRFKKVFAYLSQIT